jgi:3-isopropylmalate/(R)-2-methylmalate dehydratase large subunit
MSSSNGAKTLFEKVWERHVVQAETGETPAILYVDLHLVHEVTSPQAFSELDARGLQVRRPDRTYATLDHSTPTTPPAADGSRAYVTKEAESQVATLERNCAKHGISLAGWDSDTRCVWRAGVRHRHIGGRPRAGDAVLDAA